MTQQSLTAAFGIVLSFVVGILASRGLISKETAAYLAGPETTAFLGVLALVVLGGWTLWANRPHGIIKAAAALPQVDAVVVAPKTAGEIPTDNVVATAEAAEPFVKARRRRASPASAKPAES